MFNSVHASLWHPHDWLLKQRKQRKPRVSWTRLRNSDELSTKTWRYHGDIIEEDFLSEPFYVVCLFHSRDETGMRCWRRSHLFGRFLLGGLTPTKETCKLAGPVAICWLFLICEFVSVDEDACLHPHQIQSLGVDVLLPIHSKPGNLVWGAPSSKLT